MIKYVVLVLALFQCISCANMRGFRGFQDYSGNLNTFSGYQSGDCNTYKTMNINGFNRTCYIACYGASRETQCN